MESVVGVFAHRKLRFLVHDVPEIEILKAQLCNINIETGRYRAVTLTSLGIHFQLIFILMNVVHHQLKTIWY